MANVNVWVTFNFWSLLNNFLVKFAVFKEWKIKTPINNFFLNFKRIHQDQNGYFFIIIKSFKTMFYFKEFLIQNSRKIILPRDSTTWLV